MLVPLRKTLVTGVVMSETGKPSFRAKPISTCFTLPPIPTKSLELLNWLQVFYASSLGSVAQQYLAGSLTARTVAAQQKISEYPKPTPLVVPTLTAAQKNIIAKLPRSGTALLHGDTGTGKTRLYIELAVKAIGRGKSVIILTPEISLTSQLTESFQRVFGHRVLLTHSGLTTAQRRDKWLQCLKSTDPLIVIGPRSALFSPLKLIGLIVVDESHDDAYKQDSMPSYHATRVAAKLASLHEALLLLGSATPSVSDYFLAEQKNKPILRLTERPKENPTMTVNTRVTDMRNRTEFTQNTWLSNTLIAAIREALRANEQSLLFLNRRGTSRITLCASCGWRALCDHCGTPMTFHEDSFLLKCHTCSKTVSVPSNCPDCENSDILFHSVGTKAIETAIKRLFPESTVMRFDTDNKKSERLEQHYQTVKNGKVDILIGTQLLTKGLDLPHLGVVGVLNADLSLQIPDFTAEEKTYQLLSQVVGRVGRGHRSGTVIVQTYNPTNRAITDALARNWIDFYRRELAERKAFFFPPFSHMLVLRLRRKSSESAQEISTKLMIKLQRIANIQIDNPTPSYHLRVGGLFEWRLIVRSNQREKLLKIASDLPNGWYFDIDPVNLL